MAYIYITTNKINGHQYIGKTTRSILLRMREHYNKAIKHTYNMPFHYAIAKYGIDCFHIECLTVSDKTVDLWEKHLIKKWSPVYNIHKGGNGGALNTGRVFSQEWKDNISKSVKGVNSGSKNFFYGKPSENRKPIYLINTEGIKTKYKSITHAANSNNLDISALCAIVNGRRKSHKGYTAKYI